MQQVQAQPAAAAATPSWLAIPRAVWIGAAAFGIAAASAGAAMWLQPERAAAPAAPQALAAVPAAPAAPAKASPAAPLAAKPAAPVAAAPCATCGVVESVQAVKKKGEGTGLGAVAGGVVGGAVGSQMGKGNGRTAMTVLGAIGGGVAGHEIEKRARAETVYQVRVRMDDGSVRSFQRPQPLNVGTPVTVQGQSLRVAQHAPA
jgi:outer membrane lipoprotein SlyB